MNTKRLIGLLALAVILVAGIYSMIYTFNNAELTYDGSNTDVTQLLADPSSYKAENVNGIADVIVGTNLEKTMAVNNVAIANVSSRFIILFLGSDLKDTTKKRKCM